MPLEKLLLKEKALTNSCKTCLQRDCFDSKNHYCSRCNPIKKEDLATESFYKFDPKNNPSDNIKSFLCIFITIFCIFMFFTCVPLTFELSSIIGGLIFIFVCLFPIFFLAKHRLSIPTFAIDQKTSKIILFHDFLFTFEKKFYDFSDIDFVEVSSQIGPNKSEAIYIAKAYLKSNYLSKNDYDRIISYSSSTDITIDKSYNYLEVLRTAKLFAGQVGVKLEDAFQRQQFYPDQGQQVYSPDTLSLNLIGRLLKDHPITFPKEPKNSKLKYYIDDSNNLSVFTLPTIPVGGIVALVIVLLFAFLCQELLGYFFSSWIDIFIITYVLTIIIVSISKTKERVLVTPKSLLLEKYYLFGSKILTEISLSDLQEIKLIDKSLQLKTNSFSLGIPLAAISDKNIIKFGTNLNLREAEWLLNTLEYRIYMQNKNFSKDQNISPPEWE